MIAVRPTAVAGSFYPREPSVLRAVLADHLAKAPPNPARRGPHPPKLLVVPHAGYVYSGDIAALAFATLQPWRDVITRVVLLGPTHRVPLRGIAVPTVDAFETPLGRVAVEPRALEAFRQVVWSDGPHALEHSLEVELPFLQSVLGDGFSLVPLAVGEASAAEVAEVLEGLWGGDETLIVISSDLSHYLPYARARERDAATIDRILGFATDLQGDEACGALPLNGALLAARRHGLQPRLLGRCNSADAQPMADRNHVVGYAAIAFDAAMETTASADDELGDALLETARRAIAGALGMLDPGPAAASEHPALYRPGASFVTLRDARGALRGCIGRLEATRPLRDDVHANALGAAFSDFRFAPLQAWEWAGLQLEISLLDPPEPLPVRNETEALAALQPGVDGVIFEWRGVRATLLPQVWSECPRPADFLAALKQKARLPADFWADDVRLSRYRVRRYQERGNRHDEARGPA